MSIEIRNIAKRFGSFVALDNLSLRQQKIFQATRELNTKEN